MGRDRLHAVNAVRSLWMCFEERTHTKTTDTRTVLSDHIGGI